jgi:FKBP-type peptidyl-prolyl cis-trans isomerase 2
MKMTTDTTPNTATEDLTTTVVDSGATVTLHYEGTLNDQTQFDSSFERDEPITITLGEGQLLPEFESALMGIAIGERKTFSIPADKAYGERDDEAVTSLDRSIFPADLELTVGLTVPLMNSQTKQTMMVTLTEINETTITGDFNHPLAGQDLTFTVEVLEVA